MDKLLLNLDHCNIPLSLRPFVIAVSGNGRTSKGVMEILKHLPNIQMIEPDDLSKLY
jgi:hypothetical protein